MPEPTAPSPHAAPNSTPPPRPPNFIEQLIDADLAAGRWGLGRGAVIQTRFPPEPNGYLHIGHAKSICLNYGLAQKYGGKFNLRFDDTNPAKEEQEYVDSIKADVAWITSAFGGSYDAGPHAGGVYFASDYFDTMYAYALELIDKGKAYVCELSADGVSTRRGTPTIPATSPFRDRPPAESRRLLAEMKAGQHADGSMTLRAKIDLASPNFNLRDPVLYRILHEHHHNTGDAWCIYPMYDWAHGFEDSLEKVTHSICTLEFENHRPLYDWFIHAVNEGRAPADRIWHSQQIEFAKLQLTGVLISKRNLLKMVQDKVVAGWDDPRFPTIAAFRRRGYPPQAIRDFCEDVGVTKVESRVDFARLENACREVLNKTAPRAMGVLRPLKVTIENWPEGKVDWLDFTINPEHPAAGTRKVPFSRELFIERDDFMEVPAKKFFRLCPGQEVRLRWAYFLKCVGVEKDGAGNVTAVRCTIDPATRGGDAPPGPHGEPPRKVKGTIHWVSAEHSAPARVRLYDRLFTADVPGERTGNFLDDLNPHALEEVEARVEPTLAKASVGDRFQFERLGYFILDRDSRPGMPVFNRTVTLKDTWVKEAAKTTGA